MVWVLVTLLIVMAVSILLDLADYKSEGNRVTSSVDFVVLVVYTNLKRLQSKIQNSYSKKVKKREEQ